MLRRLTNFGVAAELPIDQRVALRTTNVIALLLVAFSPGIMVGWYVDAKVPPMALASGLFATLYLICYLMNGARLRDAARFALITTASVHLSVSSLTLGPGAGFEFYVAALIAFPFLIFAKAERTKMVATYGLLLVPILAAIAWHGTRPPLVSVPPSAMTTAYWSNATVLAVVLGGTLIYYHFSSLSARRDLDAERRRTEEILANAIPAWIAARLKSGERTIADAHGEATILFADLVDFSKLATRLAPSHLVEILDTVFSRFDELAERHAIEKIKTIGDCYMAAGGVLAEGGSRTSAVADLALDMLKVVDEIGSDIGYPLQLRIGISTGPVISGVLGRNKFQFDVWGDTVNLASRMQEYSDAGRIQVSEATYWRLHNQYEFENRGAIDVKGHDRVPAYFLIGHKPPAVRSGAAA